MAMQAPTPNANATMGTIVSLDVGERRIGVAIADTEVRLARPLVTLEHTPDIAEKVQTLLAEQHAIALVVGLPRGLDGQHTGQTAYVEAFAKTLQPVVVVPIHWQDEALTSRKAEAELESRGKPYKKGDIDALSATYILEDFLHDNPTLETLETHI